MSSPERTRTTRSLRSWRLDAGWTHAELAARASVSRPVVLRIEGGELRDADGWALVRLADALGVTPDLIHAAHDQPETTPGALRALRGIDRRKLSELTGIPHATITRAERGAAVHPHYAKRLADFYGVRVSAFYPAPTEDGGR